MAGAISGVTVTPTRPTENTLMAWDVGDSPEAGKQNNWMPWTRSPGYQYSPGQSFYVASTVTVTGFALQLNTSLVGESIVKYSNNAPISIDLEGYGAGNLTYPAVGISSFTGNLPANFDDNAWAHGQWVTFTLDTPTEFTGGGYYGFRLYFNDEPETGRDIKFNTGYWGDGTTTVDGAPGHWAGGGYSPWNPQAQAGIEDLQFVLIGEGAAAVPEPASFGLLGAAGVAVLLRRRR